MDEAEEQLKEINEKVKLIQTENKFIAKRLAKDIEQRERSENGAYRIGALLDQVLELSEADKRQNNEVTEMIFAILETNRKISELNQTINELHRSDGDLSSLVEDVDQEVNEVSNLLTTSANSYPAQNSVSDDDVEELSILENKSESRGESLFELEEKTEDLQTCRSESMCLSVDGSIGVDNAPHYVKENSEELASVGQSVLEPESEDQMMTQVSKSTEDAENDTACGTSDDFTKEVSHSEAEFEQNTKKEEAPGLSKELVESSKIWRDKMSDTDQDSLKKLRKRKTPIEVDNRCTVLLEEESQRKTEKEDQRNKEDVPAYLASEDPEMDTLLNQSDPENLLKRAAVFSASPMHESLGQFDRVEDDFWLKQAAIDAAEQQALKHQQGRGLDIIFVLDTSASMEGEGMRQMKGAVTDILNELERNSALNVNVAIITFGCENKFHRHCSNRYYSLKRSLDELRCGGSSPIGAGLFLTRGTQGSVGVSVVRNWYVRPRVVLISDGIATDYHYPNGSEDMHPREDKREIKEELLSVAQLIGDNRTILCVPVGDPDMTVLEMISGLSDGGKIVHLHEAKRIGRFPRNVQIAAELNEIMKTCEKMDRASFQTTMSTIISGPELTDSDWDDIYEMVTSSGSEFKSPAMRADEVEDAEYQERYSYMPPIGTRVKRGPEWRWGDQDKHGPGTVIGHSTRPGHINVRWDSGKAYPYPYGANGEFSIVVCDSPRVLDDQMIAVGCLVIRGPDWEWGDQDGGEGSIGVVYRVNDVAVVHVRWPSGAKSNYRFGFDGKFDVKICDPFSPEVKRVLQQQGTTATASNITPESESSSSKKFEKKSERKRDSSEQEPQMTFEEIRRTGSSLDIMDMAPPIKHTVWSDFSISSATTLRSRSLTADQRLANGQQKAAASNMKQETQDRQSNESTNTDVKKTPSMGDSVSMEILPTDSSKKKKCDQASKETIEQNVDNKDFKSDHLEGQSKSNEPFSNTLLSTTEEANTDFNTRSETSSESLEPKPEASSDNESCDKVPSWQWKHPDGKWIAYPENVQEKLRKNFLKNPKSTVLISLSDSHFRVVFSKNKHINTETKDSAEIRKIYE
ncbi:uncharacterized protein LOC111105409 isoform X2 [Crassostrea virginica]